MTTQNTHRILQIIRTPGAALLLASILIAGCHKTEIGKGGDYHQRELMLAFIAAHDKNDLDAEQQLVDWGGVSDGYKAHFIEHQLKSELGHKILSADIVDLPKGMEAHFQGYNIIPEKFLAIHYDDDPADRGNLYPMGQKDGRYYIAMQSGNPD
jgi:hypothetical protein